MAEIINLRQARKARDRAAREAQAEENRAKSGRPKADRTLAAAKDELARRRHEAHRRESDETE